MSHLGPLTWRDGELIPTAEATVHVLSHAANRGSEVFDVLRVVETGDGPAAVGLRNHVARFDHSMALMGMTPDHDIGGLERAVAETVLANPGTTTVKLVAAWVDVPLGTAPATRRPTLFVLGLANRTRSGSVVDPVRVMTATMPKIPSSILPPELKIAASYAPAIRHQLAAVDAGYDEVVMRTVDGRLAESVTQSLLVVAGGRLLVPPLDSVLDGITRRLLVDLAHDDRLTVEVRDVHWDEVEGADELFFTSTSVFVRPVATLDDVALDAPGPVSTRLGQLVDELLAGHHRLTTRWLTPLAPLTEGRVD